jgi:hypothetical protein
MTHAYTPYGALLRAFRTNANSNQYSPDKALTGFRPIRPTRSQLTGTA